MLVEFLWSALGSDSPSNICYLFFFFLFCQVGRVDLVVVVDCKEEKLRRRLLGRSPRADRVDSDARAVEKRLVIFKGETLPVIKHFDDKGLVVVVGIK
jgi:adenylate kinase